MLPFLKSRRIATVLMAKKSPEGKIEEESKDDYAEEGLLQASTDLLRAIQAKDPKATAKAFRAAFEVCEGYEDSEEEEKEEEAS